MVVYNLVQPGAPKGASGIDRVTPFHDLYRCRSELVSLVSISWLRRLVGRSITAGYGFLTLEVGFVAGALQSATEITLFLIRRICDEFLYLNQPQILIEVTNVQSSPRDAVTQTSGALDWTN